MQQQPSSKIGNEKKTEITNEFCKALIGGKQSGEERTEEEGRGSKVTVLTCADVCRWKCWLIVAVVQFCKDTQEIRYKVVILFYDSISMFSFWAEGHKTHS